jgi:hypothetical protein
VGAGVGAGVGLGVGAGVGLGEGPSMPRHLTMSAYGMFWQWPPAAKCDSDGLPSCGHFCARYWEVL